MKYYIIAGEASGDLHGSNLMTELQLLDREAVFRGWGGDKMLGVGLSLFRHYREQSFMGFIEVFMNLRTSLKNISDTKQDISTFHPDALILIDFPGFNLRIAEWAREKGYKIIYYISPQVWAWKESRVKIIKRCVDKMLVILPFEKEFYKKWGYEVEYVGHPLVEVIESEKSKINIQKTGEKPIIALLPGSRKQEILKKLPIMLEVCKDFPEYQFVVAQAPSQDDALYKSFTDKYQNAAFVKDQTYDLLSRSKAALVTSGTATLETALFGVPEVVCYKGHPLSYTIAKRLIKVKYISLVNLIMDRLVVKELIQDEMNPANLKKELTTLLHDEMKITEIKNDYEELKNRLAAGGHASANAARAINSYLNNPE